MAEIGFSIALFEIPLDQMMSRFRTRTAFLVVFGYCGTYSAKSSINASFEESVKELLNVDALVMSFMQDLPNKSCAILPLATPVTG